MTSYCAPCLADLALVREAVTSVSGTAACVAHAVLLTHPGDSPQRRLERLADLRAMAEGKLATSSAEEVAQIELIVQEYALAGAMDMTVPLQQLAGERTPRPPKSRNRRGRDRGPDRERGPDRGPDRERGPRPPGTPGEAPAASPDQSAAEPEAGGGTDAEAPGVPAPSEQTTPAAPQPAPELSASSGAPAPPAADNAPSSAPEAPSPAAPQPVPESAPQVAPEGPGGE